MACDSCKKVVEFGRSGLEYSRSSRDLTDRYGKSIPKTGSIVLKQHMPTGGWGVAFFVNDIQVRFEGGSSEAVFTKVAENFEMNSVPFTITDLWFNLNLQWLDRQPRKYRKVGYPEFLALADPEEFSEPQDSHAKSTWHPRDWQETAFDFLALYLAGQSYQYGVFIILVDHLLDMYNPTKSPLTGHSSKYVLFMSAVKKLKDSPLYEVGGARGWLFNTYSKCVNGAANEDTFYNKHHWL